MPNGGVPINMVLFPKDGHIAIFCHAGEMKIYSRPDWEVKGVDATPLASFSESEAAAIAWFLQYWLGSGNLKPGWSMTGIDAQFDY